MLDKKPNLVMVQWRDARFYPGAHTQEVMEGYRMVLFESVGYLVSCDAVTTVLAGERNDEEGFGYGDITLIPTGSVVFIRRLRLGSVVEQASRAP